MTSTTPSNLHTEWVHIQYEERSAFTETYGFAGNQVISEPLLVIENSADDAVPQTQPKKLFAAAASPDAGSGSASCSNLVPEVAPLP